jgi:hypothetical protein
LRQASHHRSKQPFLIPEIEVNRSLGDSRLPGDFVNASCLIPVRSENLESGRQDFLLTVQLQIPPARGGLGCLYSPGIYGRHASLHIMTERSVIIYRQQDNRDEKHCQLTLGRKDNLAS